MRASVSVRTGGCFLEPGIAGDRIKCLSAPENVREQP